MYINYKKCSFIKLTKINFITMLGENVIGLGRISQT